MSKKNFLVFGTFMLMIVCLCLPSPSQEAKKDQQKMMEEYMKLMVPHENHAYFKNFVGNWDVKSTAWMEPGAQPSVGQNSSQAELIMGGRFLKMAFKGNMFGQPFEGLQIVGYDNLEKKYITFWIDNSSTSFYFTSGSRDESGKVMNETGLWPDPMTGGKMKVRAVTRIISQDEYIYELYMVGPDGKEFKSLENRATRKK